METYNDFHLLDLINDKNEEAFELLFKKYKMVIDIKSRKYSKFGTYGFDINDLKQEGMIGLNDAIKGFKVDKNIKFSTFATLCIERKMQALVIKHNRKKHKILNDAFSLDYVAEDSDEPLYSYISESEHMIPENVVINFENHNNLYDNIINLLTPFEREVIELKIKNFSYKEIAKILDKSPKSIDNALQRIKGKIKELT